MKKLNSRLDSITKPFIEVGPWLLRLTLGISMFIHGYKKLPAPFMIDEQHRMVTWFESMFIPAPELLVNLVIFTEVIGGIGIILGGLIGFIASQLGHLITRASAFSLFLLMIGVFLIGHPDWFEWPPIKLFNSEQIFLSVIVIYFLIKGNK
ncbi:DoxX family protein [SAR86 cluster bacterium]|jgi:uncharacterized membrane protein YphA (DoxX/SURF4 family)|nr:DoxX family protein [SAR86 cluster bacterium]